MRYAFKLLTPLITIIVIVILAIPANGNIVSDYITAVRDGDIETAESFWLNDLIGQSKRMNITYRGMDAKFDCNSPILEYIEDIRTGRIRVIAGAADEHEGYSKYKVTLLYSSHKEYYDYYVVPFGGEWKIADKSYVFARSWPVIQTRYVDLRVGDSTRINKFALSELDRSIEKIAVKLGLNHDALRELEEKRIQYYLCNEEQIKQLTGHKAEGMTDLAFDIIYSQHLPHQHELVHFLINYKLRDLPLYTLPIMQEGLAVALGGRWGKSPEIILQLGNILLDNEFLQLDQILTYNDFVTKAGSAEMSYPVSGLFVDMIINNFGADKLVMLYRSLSDNRARLVARSADDFKMNTIPRILGISYDELKVRFDEYRTQYKSTGLIAGMGTSSFKEIKNIKEGDFEVGISSDENQYLFHIKSDSKLSGCLLFGDGNQSPEIDYQSWMFHEQIPESEYNGERFGLVFDTAEAGFYDYYLNQLISKYVYGFNPDANYITEDGKEILFRMDKTVLPEPIMNYSIKLIRQ